jgi:hypothetical protein
MSEQALPPSAAQALPPLEQDALPPVTQVAIASMALIVAGGIWIASHLPHHVPLGPAVALLAASAALVVVNVVSLLRVRGFNWASFFLVARWAGLAYAITAGILLWVFVKDGTSGGQLVVLALSLVIYAIHVPLLIGFTVARYQPRLRDVRAAERT